MKKRFWARARAGAEDRHNAVVISRARAREARRGVVFGFGVLPLACSAPLVQYVRLDVSVLHPELAGKIHHKKPNHNKLLG